MPPRPFPLPLSVGTDICSIARIHAILCPNPAPPARPKLRNGARFMNRLFTEHERAQLGLLSGALSRWDECLKKRLLLAKKKTDLEAFPENLEQDSGSQDVLGFKVTHDMILKHLRGQLVEEESIANGDIKKLAPFVAGRFAAKEAAMKAYRTRRLTYHDISILKEESVNGMSQAPTVLIKKENAKGQKAWDDAQIVPMSISHDSEYATAVCIACEEHLPPPDLGVTSTSKGTSELEGEPAALGDKLSDPTKWKVRNSTLYVSGLHEGMHDFDFVAAFEGISSVTKGYICRGSGGKCLGYGFVVLASTQDVKKAISLMNGSILMGNYLHCSRAKKRLDPILAQLGNVQTQKATKVPILELKPTKWNKDVARRAWERSMGISHLPTRLVKQDEITFWTNAEALLRNHKETALADESTAEIQGDLEKV